MLWFYESFFPVVWIVFVLYWQVKAADTKATQRLEPAASRLFRVLIFVIAIVLLTVPRIPLPWLYVQLWPMGYWPFWLGAVLTVAGILFGSGSSSAWRRNGCASILGRHMARRRRRCGCAELHSARWLAPSCMGPWYPLAENRGEWGSLDGGSSRS
jgi:hypothetical protein